MATFEVQIPDSTGASVSFTMEVEATDWMSALAACLDELGQELDVTRARCSLTAEGSVSVAGEGPDAGRRFVVVPLAGAGLHGPPARPEPDLGTTGRLGPRPATSRMSTDPMVPLDLIQQQLLDPARPVLGASRGAPSDLPDGPGSGVVGRERPRAARFETRPGLPVAGQRTRGQGARKVSPTRLLAGLQKLSSSRTNVEQVIDHAVALLFDEVAADAVQMVLPDHSGTGWRVVAARGHDAGTVVLNRLTLGEAAADALSRGEPTSLTGADATLRYESRRGRTTEHRPAALMVAPVRSDGDPIGMVLLVREGEPFDDGVAVLMRRLGAELGGLLAKRL